MRRFLFILTFCLLGVWIFLSTPVSVRADSGGGYQVFLPSISTGTTNTTNELSLEQFKSSLMDGQAETLKGVYVPHVLAFQVSQQPESNPNFISANPKEVTLFSLAASQGVTGLLAHNYLAGEQFFNLKIGQTVTLIYGNGITRTYQINRLEKFQALQPTSPSTLYRELTSSQEFSTADVFERFYMGEDHITFQTCIRDGNNWSWGRLFVVATPIQ